MFEQELEQLIIRPSPNTPSFQFKGQDVVVVIVVLVVATSCIRDWESPWKLPSHVSTLYVLWKKRFSSACWFEFTLQIIYFHALNWCIEERMKWLNWKVNQWFIKEIKFHVWIFLNSKFPWIFYKNYYSSLRKLIFTFKEFSLNESKGSIIIKILPFHFPSLKKKIKSISVCIFFFFSPKILIPALTLQTFQIDHWTTVCVLTPIFDKVLAQLRIKRGRIQAKKESGKVAFTGIWIVRSRGRISRRRRRRSGQVPRVRKGRGRGQRQQQARRRSCSRFLGPLLLSAAGPSHATRMHLPTHRLPTLLPDS